MANFKSQDKSLTNSLPKITNETLVEEVCKLREFSLVHISQFIESGAINFDSICESTDFNITSNIQNKEDALKAREWYSAYVAALPDNDNIRFGAFYRMLDIINSDVQ